MPRPQKQTVEYFSHDADAGNSRTLSVLFNYFGHEGISAWWLLLERLARTRNHIICINGGEDTEVLAANLHFRPDRLKEILSKMAELGAIDPELFKTGRVWCQHFVERLEPVYQKRGQALPRKPGLAIPETLVSAPETLVSVPDSIPPQGYEESLHYVPPLKLKRERERLHPPLLSFEEYKKSLKPRYPELDVDREWEACQIWWSEGKKEMARPKSALRNWLEIARDKLKKAKPAALDPYEDMTGKGPD